MENNVKRFIVVDTATGELVFKSRGLYIIDIHNYDIFWGLKIKGNCLYKYDSEYSYCIGSIVKMFDTENEAKQFVKERHFKK